jgi:hypothetical protein
VLFSLLWFDFETPHKQKDCLHWKSKMNKK